MANKPLKGINFPGLEDTYVTAGYPTEANGEIFNDYENNRADAPYSHAGGNNSCALAQASFVHGTNSVAGTLGFFVGLVDYGNKALYLTTEPVKPVLPGDFKDADGNWLINKDNYINQQIKTSEYFEIGDIFSLQAQGYYHWLPDYSLENTDNTQPMRITGVYPNNKITFANYFAGTSQNPIDETAYKKIIGSEDWVKNENGIYDDVKMFFNVPLKPLTGEVVNEGNDSIALGYENIAASKFSAAIGMDNLAYGMYSHAEGKSTGAAYAAHSEGYGTNAVGFYSHAEGKDTRAKGEMSHAEGYNTGASGKESHAEGHSTLAIGQGSHSEGGPIINSDNSLTHTIARGKFSHAEGEGTEAIGNAAHSEGKNTAAIGSNSHAEGEGSYAYSTGSHAEGIGTTTGEFSAAAHAEGGNTTASGSCSHAEGDCTTASGWGSHAEGESTYAGGNGSHAEGIGTRTEVGIRAAHAEGENSYAGGNGSHAEGIGTRTELNADAAHAEGKSTKASGIASHAEGENTTASKWTAHAEGYWTTASNLYAHAEGYYTEASGENAHAEGSGTKATNISAHAEGRLAEANGARSHAEGLHTIAAGVNQHVQGKYNLSNASYAHIVGNGTSDTKRSNAHTLDWNGDAWFAGNVYVQGLDKTTNSQKLATEEFVKNNKIGLITDSNGEIFNDYEKNIADKDCHAEGSGTAATRGYAHAEGFGTQAYWRSHAQGFYTHARADSMAGGRMSFAAGPGALAFGMEWNGDGLSLLRDPLRLKDDTKIAIDSLAGLEENDFICLDGMGYSDVDEEMFILTDIRKIISIESRVDADTNIEYFILEIDRPFYEPLQPTYSAIQDQDSFIINNASVRKASFCEAIGSGTVAFGCATKATGNRSFASGHMTEASGAMSSAFNNKTKAIGENSHAEGDNTTAGGKNSHAEGEGTNALGRASHAEGFGTEASNTCTHAEGTNTHATHEGSHTGGAGTQSGDSYQYVIGRYNDVADSAGKAFVIGVGNTNNDRKNGFTVDKQGNVHIVGDAKIDKNIFYGKDNINLIQQVNDLESDFNDFNQLYVSEMQAYTDQKISELVNSAPETLDTLGELAEALQNDQDVAAQLVTQVSELKANSVGKKDSTYSSSEIFNDYANNKVTHNFAHAEGKNTEAFYCSHAEGNGSKANGSSSHAENQSEVTTYGAYAHSEGVGTVAATRASHVQGRFNIIDNSTTAENQFGQYAHIVGNGTSNSNRSNAHTLDWEGNAWYAGSGSFGTSVNIKGRPGNPSADSLGEMIDWDPELRFKYANGDTAGVIGVATGYGAFNSILGKNIYFRNNSDEHYILPDTGGDSVNTYYNIVTSNTIHQYTNYGTASDFETFKNENPDVPDGTIFYVYE